MGEELTWEHRARAAKRLGLDPSQYCFLRGSEEYADLALTLEHSLALQHDVVKRLCEVDLTQEQKDDALLLSEYANSCIETIATSLMRAAQKPRGWRDWLGR